MIKHIILWKLKNEIAPNEKAAVTAGIKAGLEALQGKIPGLQSIKVRTQKLASSNADVMLDCSFDDEASLQNYAVHPAHVAVANSKVRPFTEIRLCLDYAEDAE